MLLRILARFSCLALQKNWNNEIKASLESLLEDQDSDVKTVGMPYLRLRRKLPKRLLKLFFYFQEAKCALDEFKYLSFIAAETAY